MMITALRKLRSRNLAMLAPRPIQLIFLTSLISTFIYPNIASATVISVESSGEYKVDEVKDFRQREPDISQDLSNELETQPENTDPRSEPFMARIISTPDAGTINPQKENLPTAPKTLTITKNPYGEIIEDAAQINPKLDTALIKAVIEAESNYDANAVSPKGAMGLMQLMPATAARHGVTNPFDPAQNIQGGARELNALMEANANISLALAAYNAGQGAVDTYKGIPPYEETQTYVVKVLTKTFHYRQDMIDEEARLAEKPEVKPVKKEKPRPMKVYTFDWQDNAE